MDVGRAITEAMREQRARDMWDVFSVDPRRMFAAGGLVPRGACVMASDTFVSPPQRQGRGR